MTVPVVVHSTLIPFLLLLILGTLASARKALEVSTRQFRVMTLNAFNFVDAPDWDKRVYEIREMVLSNNPDCVAFEEVRIVNGSISMYDDLVEHLKDKYPSWKYGTASKFSPKEEEGVAIACKWAIHSASITTMKRLFYCSDPLTRVVVRMSVAVGRKTLEGTQITSTDLVDIYATHWSYSKCNQEMNAMKTLEFVNSSSVGESAFILGDFNAYNEAPPALMIMEQVPVHLGGNYNETYYMKDSWRALYPNPEMFPGYTFSSLKNKKGLHNRCDRIFYSGKATPLSAEIICENPGRELIPSDHCAYSFTAVVPYTRKPSIFDMEMMSALGVHWVMILVNIVLVALFFWVLMRKMRRRRRRHHK